jgi:hypothetical protein
VIPVPCAGGVIEIQRAADRLRTHRDGGVRAGELMHISLDVRQSASVLKQSIISVPALEVLSKLGGRCCMWGRRHEGRK